MIRMKVGLAMLVSTTLNAYRDTVGSVLVTPVEIGIGDCDGVSAFSSISRPLLS